MELFNIKPNFEEMNNAELRAYVLENREDQTAFYALIDRLTSEANPQTFAMAKSDVEVEEVNRLIEEKIQRKKL